MYSSAGERWRWRDRLLLTQRQLEALLVSPGNSIHVLYVDNVAAGGIELTKSDESTKIVYLGLCPDYIAKDLGKDLPVTVLNKLGMIMLNASDFTPATWIDPTP